MLGIACIECAIGFSEILIGELPIRAEREQGCMKETKKNRQGFMDNIGVVQ